MCGDGVGCTWVCLCCVMCMCYACVIDFYFSSVLCCHHTFSFSHFSLTLCSHHLITAYSSSPIHPLLTPHPLSLLPLTQVGEDRLIRFSGCKSGSACTIILRGASSHLLDEAERSLHDALCVLTETVKETRCVCVCV